jgi:hypothetical protein
MPKNVDLLQNVKIFKNWKKQETLSRKFEIIIIVVEVQRKESQVFHFIIVSNQRKQNPKSLILCLHSNKHNTSKSSDVVNSIGNSLGFWFCFIIKWTKKGWLHNLRFWYVWNYLKPPDRCVLFHRKCHNDSLLSKYIGLCLTTCLQSASTLQLLLNTLDLMPYCSSMFNLMHLLKWNRKESAWGCSQAKFSKTHADLVFLHFANRMKIRFIPGVFHIAFPRKIVIICRLVWV